MENLLCLRGVGENGERPNYFNVRMEARGEVGGDSVCAGVEMRWKIYVPWKKIFSAPRLSLTGMKGSLLPPFRNRIRNAFAQGMNKREGRWTMMPAPKSAPAPEIPMRQ